MQFFIKFSVVLVVSFFVGCSTFSQGTKMLPRYKEIKQHVSCKADIEACQENLKIGAANFPLYASRGGADIENIIVIIHGMNRNANEYLHDFISSIGDSSMLSSTLVVAPHFLQVDDAYAEKQLRWEKNWEQSWKYGYASSAPIKMSSYEVMDHLVDAIDQNWHPKKIIIAGHSAGAQFVQRYAHGSQVAQRVKSHITFVVSNPSSYLYSRPERPVNGAWEIPTGCPDYNEYIYGLEKRNEYLQKFSNEEMEDNYLQNHLVYLIGGTDVLSEDLDTSCGANVQGANRLERATNYFRFLKTFYSRNGHRLIFVPGVGHDHIKMFSSQQFLDLVTEQASVDEGDKDLSISRLGSKNIHHKHPTERYFLMGGGVDSTAAFTEFLRAADGGDFLVLSAFDTPLEYNRFIWDLARKKSIPLNSVTTALIHSRKGAEDPRLLKLIADSEAIFFTGGDQWEYIDRIKGTLAHEEILKKLRTGIPFGGTSAGLAIMGDVIFTAEKDTVHSKEVFNNPLHEKITLTDSMFGIASLKNIITDTHFSKRDRMGRLLAFMANSYHAKNSLINGLGVDEDAVLILNPNGEAHIVGNGSAYLLSPFTAPHIEPGHFNWEKIGVRRWGTGKIFSLLNLPSPHYFFQIQDGEINSSQAGGGIY